MEETKGHSLLSCMHSKEKGLGVGVGVGGTGRSYI